MSNTEFQRIALLNRIVTRSVSRAPEEHKAPTHGAFELLQMIDRRRRKKVAIEYLNALDDDDEDIRAKNGIGHNFLRLRSLRFEEADDWREITSFSARYGNTSRI